MTRTLLAIALIMSVVGNTSFAAPQNDQNIDGCDLYLIQDNQKAKAVPTLFKAVRKKIKNTNDRGLNFAMSFVGGFGSVLIAAIPFMLGGVEGYYDLIGPFSPTPLRGSWGHVRSFRSSSLDAKIVSALHSIVFGASSLTFGAIGALFWPGLTKANLLDRKKFTEVNRQKVFVYSFGPSLSVLEVKTSANLNKDYVLELPEQNDSTHELFEVMGLNPNAEEYRIMISINGKYYRGYYKRQDTHHRP